MATNPTFKFYLKQDEFLDVIYWGRQIVAVIIGIIWGYLGMFNEHTLFTMRDAALFTQANL